MSEQTSGLEFIEADVRSHVVCSNLNRVCILHLLSKTPNNEMQAEEMSYRIGISHRTVLYHLDILHDLGLVEVRKFLKRGSKHIRSVWGLRNNSKHLKATFLRITKSFDSKVLDEMVSMNLVHQ